jgi:hypothetical protein
VCVCVCVCVLNSLFRLALESKETALLVLTRQRAALLGGLSRRVEEQWFRDYASAWARRSLRSLRPRLGFDLDTGSPRNQHAVTTAKQSQCNGIGVGVGVTKVNAGSSAEKAGLKPGDYVVKVTVRDSTAYPIPMLRINGTSNISSSSSSSSSSTLASDAWRNFVNLCAAGDLLELLVLSHDCTSSSESHSNTNPNRNSGSSSSSSSRAGNKLHKIEDNMKDGGSGSRNGRPPPAVGENLCERGGESTSPPSPRLRSMLVRVGSEVPAASPAWLRMVRRLAARNDQAEELFVTSESWGCARRDLVLKVGVGRE